MALELACSPWTDDLRLTLVGDDRLSPALAQHNVQTAPDLDALLERWERLDRDRQAHGGGLDARTLRLDADLGEAWTPEVVLVDGPLTPEQAERLSALTAHRPGTGLTAVVRGELGRGAGDLRARGRRPGDPRAGRGPDGSADAAGRGPRAAGRARRRHRERGDAAGPVVVLRRAAGTSARQRHLPGTATADGRAGRAGEEGRGAGTGQPRRQPARRATRCCSSSAPSSCSARPARRRPGPRSSASSTAPGCWSTRARRPRRWRPGCSWPRGPGART